MSDSSGALYLTRNGSFVPDASGNLVNSAGYYLMGNDIQNGPASGASNSLAGMQKVNVMKSGETATPTTSGTLAVNLPSTAPVVAGALPSSNAANATYSDQTSLVALDNLGGSQTINFYMTNTGVKPRPARTRGRSPLTTPPTRRRAAGSPIRRVPWRRKR